MPYCRCWFIQPARETTRNENGSRSVRMTASYHADSRAPYSSMFSINLGFCTQRHLRWTLKRYIRYYLDSRSHLSLEKDSPNSRPVQSVGQIMAIPQVGGLHHRYQRRAA